MEAYHAALFGYGFAPTYPAVGDKRKWQEDVTPREKPQCVALGDDVFLYVTKDKVPAQTARKTVGAGNLAAIKEEKQPPLTAARKASMLKGAGSTSKRLWTSSKGAFSSVTASITSSFRRRNPTSTEDDDVPLPQYKKLKRGH